MIHESDLSYYGPYTPLYKEALDDHLDGRCTSDTGFPDIWLPKKVDVIEIPKLLPPTVGYVAGEGGAWTPRRGYFSTYDFGASSQGTPHQAGGKAASGNPFGGLYGFLDHTSYFTWIFCISSFHAPTVDWTYALYYNMGVITPDATDGGDPSGLFGYGSAYYAGEGHPGHDITTEWWTTHVGDGGISFWGNDTADEAMSGEYRYDTLWFRPPGYWPAPGDGKGTSPWRFRSVVEPADADDPSLLQSDGAACGPGWTNFVDWMRDVYRDSNNCGWMTYVEHNCWWNWFEYDDSLEGHTWDDAGQIIKYSSQLNIMGVPDGTLGMFGSSNIGDIDPLAWMGFLSSPQVHDPPYTTSYVTSEKAQPLLSPTINPAHFDMSNPGPKAAGGEAIRLQYRSPGVSVRNNLRERFRNITIEAPIVSDHLQDQYAAIANSLYYSIIPKEFTAKVQKAKPIPPQGVSSMIHYSSLSRTYPDDLLKGVYSQDLATLLELDAEYLAAGAMDRDYDALDQPALDPTTYAELGDEGLLRPGEIEYEYLGIDEETGKPMYERITPLSRASMDGSVVYGD